jgi:hypothetical protein
MKPLIILTVAAILASCSASYDSPRTGFKYRVEVPLSAVERYFPPSTK